MSIELGGVAFNKILGKRPNDYEWISEPVSLPFLDGSEVEIRLNFNDQELADYKDDIATTVRNTLHLDQQDKAGLRPYLYEYYSEVVADLGEDWLDDMPPQPNDAAMLDFVRLYNVSVGRSQLTQTFYSQFTGGCDWEPEHGLAVSFKQGQHLAMVGSCSGHLCNADAYDDETRDDVIFYG